ncbi:hypothetical protein HanIR_Chr16g0803411 [Helianthus annuus]|nr:hypothetical protein HanIR_Chr16g0803411 [Helianthus annuus]
MFLQNCVLEADNQFSSKHIFRLFMFYKRTNQIITSKCNLKHPLSQVAYHVHVFLFDKLIASIGCPLKHMDWI